MKIITPDCEYKQDVQKYKENLKHLPKGSRVLIKRSDPAGISEALIGNWELGLVSIPVEPYSTPKSVIEFITKDCSPHAIVNCTDNDIIFEFLEGGDLSPKTDHAIFYTSGTTGNPKGVVQTREGMQSNAVAVATLHNFSNDSIHLTALPLYHCNAAAMSLFGNYFTGGTVIFLKKFTPENYFKYINEYKATTANLVPTMVADLVKSGLPFPPSLEYVLTAATALSQEICKDFYIAYGPKLRQGYGLSEAVNFSFTMPLMDDAEFKREMVDNYPAVGKLVQGSFRIKDGEVQLSGENLLRCYWNNEEATKNAFDDGWFKTGDRGELRGEYLVLTGRFKEIIIKGGENYSPVMLEDEFRRSGVAGDLAVVACKDKRLGEDIALVCENYQYINLNNKLLQPASVRYGKVHRTQTRKPQRGKMSSGLVSMSAPDHGYSATLAAAGVLAKKILQKTAINDQQLYLQNVSTKLVPYANNNVGAVYPSVQSYFERISANLDRWWDGSLDTHIFSGLDWVRLMNDVPMGAFPELANEFCRENDLYNGKVLEIGAGVGNFSKYVPAQCEYIRTDKSDKFLNGRWLIERKLDIDHRYGVDEAFDLIVGVNVMHCALNKQTAVLNAYEALRPNGILLLGEGMNPAEVWALDILFGFIDGWWNRGGFVNRHEWLGIFHKLKPQELGYSVYREGKYDLGGLVWLRK